MEKLTKRDYFNRILSYAHEEDKPFLLHEMELLEKKNASRSTKPTAKQAANISLASAVYNAMQAGTAYTVSGIKELLPELADANPQKVTGLLRILIKGGQVDRSEEKGKAYFTKI